MMRLTMTCQPLPNDAPSTALQALPPSFRLELSGDDTTHVGRSGGDAFVAQANGG